VAAQSDKPGQIVPQRIIVTGGAGFIGSNLVGELVEAGHRVDVFDDLSAGSAANLVPWLPGGHVRLVTGSILDQDLLKREIKGADLVFHLAAVVGVPQVVADPLTAIRTTVAGTENVLEACARNDCKVVLASSSEVYGKSGDLPMRESSDRVIGPTTVPRWAYSASKAVDEHLVHAYAAHGLRAAIVRYFNCYGPRMSEAADSSVVAAYVRRALAGEPLPLHGDGSQRRCFTYIGDTVSATIAAGIVPAAEGEIFNVGTDTETSVRELADLVITMTGSRSIVQPTPYADVYGTAFEDVRRRVPDCRKARDILGWTPQVGLEDGLKHTIEWWWDTRG
jgi:UDP-glucose 4-epimerase